MLLRLPTNRKIRVLEHMLTLYALYRAWSLVRRLGLRGTFKKMLGLAIAGAKAVPGLSSAVEKELKKEVDSIEQTLLGIYTPYCMQTYILNSHIYIKTPQRYIYTYCTYISIPYLSTHSHSHGTLRYHSTYTTLLPHLVCVCVCVAN